MKKIKITVMKKVCHKDLIDRYENPIENACDMVEGAVFIADGWKQVKVWSCKNTGEHIS